MDNEKVAHDLAVLYEIICALRPDDEFSPQDLFASYMKSREEFSEWLSE